MELHSVQLFETGFLSLSIMSLKIIKDHHSYCLFPYIAK